MILIGMSSYKFKRDPYEFKRDDPFEFKRGPRESKRDPG